MKSKFLSFIICLFAISSFSQSPAFEWVTEVEIQGTGFSNSNCEALVLDQQNNVVTTGYFTGNADFNAGSGTAMLNSNNTATGYVQKQSADGDFLWAVKIGSTAQSAPATALAVDNMGNIYITGYFYSTVDFDPGAGVSNLTSVGSMDAYILKLSADGSFLWVKQFGGAGTQMSQSIAVDLNNNVSVLGIFQQTTDFNPGAEVFNMTPTSYSDLFITKLDGNGDFLWSKQLGNTNPDYGFEDPVVHTIDTDGNIIVTGAYYDTFDVDPGPAILNFTASGIYNTFVLKLDLDGLFVWAKTIGMTSSSGQITSRDVTLDDDNNILIAGQFAGSADMDPGPAIFQYVSTGYDSFVLKLNNEGDFVWVRSVIGFDDDSAFEIATSSDGDCYVTGYFKGIADFDSGPNTASLTSAGNSLIADVYVLKLYSDGDYGWAFKIGTVFDDFGYSIDVDEDGSVYTYGEYRNNPPAFSYPEIDFDPGVGTYYLTSDIELPQGFFVQKVSQCTPSVYNDVQVACDSFTWSNGVTYTAPNNSATQTLVSATGCDSIVNLFLTLNVSTFFTENQSACDAFTWPLNGATYTSSGTYTFEETNAGGCPQITTLNLTVNPTTASQSQTACDSYTWPLNGTTYTSSGSYTHVSTDGSDCEVTTTLNLTINNVNVSTSLSGTTITANASGADYQWINCNNNQPIANQTNQSFTPTVSGNYAVIVSENGCEETSDCVSVIVSGVDEIVNSTIAIYPNPSSDAVTITSSSNIEKIELMNALGQVVQVFESLHINKYSFQLPTESGTYFVKIYTEKGTVNRRVVRG
jgi:hypothetical protein